MHSFRFSAFALLSTLTLGLATLTATEPPRVTGLQRTGGGVSLAWEGGAGPYVIETSRDLATWSAHGEPVNTSSATLPVSGTASFHRLLDPDPQDALAPAVALLQTDQGEFGDLLGRHRLKTRLWLHRPLNESPPAGGFVPADYWKGLTLVRQWVRDGRVVTWAGLLTNLGTVTSPDPRQLVVRWTEGSGTNRQGFTWTMQFPYPIQTARSRVPLASDPQHALSCVYAAAQPELDFDLNGLRLGSTTTDRIGLVHMAETSTGGATRDLLVREGGTVVRLHFREGEPLLEGVPPWILKTFLLDRWLSPTTGEGPSLPAFAADGYFSRTLLPGHHNFWATALIEPALDPGMPDETRAALRAANVRYVYVSKDVAGVSIGGEEQLIRFIGHDGTLRRP